MTKRLKGWELCHDNLELHVGFVIYEDSSLYIEWQKGRLCSSMWRLSISTFLLWMSFYTPTSVLWLGRPRYGSFWGTTSSSAAAGSFGYITLGNHQRFWLGSFTVIALMRCNTIFPLLLFLFASVILNMHPLWKLQHKDVYSYDAVLHEILTMWPSADITLGKGVNLVKLVHNAAKGETPEQILDARLRTVLLRWKLEMLAALKIALLCLFNKFAFSK